MPASLQKKGIARDIADKLLMRDAPKKPKKRIAQWQADIHEPIYEMDGKINVVGLKGK